MVASELCEIAARATAEEAVRIHAALEEHGVSAVIVGANANTDPSFAVLGGVRVLVRTADVTRATKILEELRGESEALGEAWFCGQCRETVDAGFDVCWSCGNARTEVEQPFPIPGSEQDFGAGSERCDMADSQAFCVSGSAEGRPAQTRHAGTALAGRKIGIPEQEGKSSGDDSSDRQLDGSPQQDDAGLVGGFALAICALLILILPIEEVPISIVSAVTGLPIGAMRLIVDLCAVIVIIMGIRKIIGAKRRVRIHRGDAGPGDLWKEARRAEQDRDFAEAVRLYGEIVKLHPSTTWAEDAASSIELLRKEEKT